VALVRSTRIAGHVSAANVVAGFFIHVQLETFFAGTVVSTSGVIAILSATAVRGSTFVDVIAGLSVAAKGVACAAGTCESASGVIAVLSTTAVIGIAFVDIDACCAIFLKTAVTHADRGI